MGFDNYVSETEALQRSGISTKTLQRFVEAGYLSVEVEPDGLRLYSRAQLDEIFGVHTAPLSMEPVEEDKDGNPIERPQSSTLDAVSEATSNIANTASINTPESVQESELSEYPLGGGSHTVDKSERAELQSPISSYYEHPAIGDPVTAVVDTSETKGVSFETSDEGAATIEREITRLKNLIELQETLLDARDSEIKGLKEERQWLRTRIEKLEEKGERDQILLLSETQTIRKLIVVQEKKGALKQLLTWVGLLPPDSINDTTTKDVMRASPVKEFRQRSESSSSFGTDSDKKVGNG